MEAKNYFNLVRFDEASNTEFYRLNGTMLRDDECHFFFTAIDEKTIKMAKRLEKMTYTSKNLKWIEGCNISVVNCGPLPLLLCSFPKELKDVCRRIASQYDMTIADTARHLVGKGSIKNFQLNFPFQENILAFDKENNGETGEKFFNYTSFNYQANMHTYQLNAAVLSDDECHIVVEPTDYKTMLIANCMEYVTFHPSNEQWNDRFQLTLVPCGDAQLMLFSFPKEFRDVCQRTAAIFGMTISKSTDAIVFLNSKTGGGQTVIIPRMDKVLVFDGKQCTFKEYNREFDRIKAIGDHIEELGVD